MDVRAVPGRPGRHRMRLPTPRCLSLRRIARAAAAAIVVASALAPLPAGGETLRFVFLADSRSEQPTVRDPKPKDLINTAALNAINDAILQLSPRPSFVIFGGDAAYRGRYNGVYTFDAFREVMAPLTDAGITLYTMVGNHELYQHPGTGFFLANQQEFQKTFTGNPGNGPPGYERLAYTFHSPGGDAFFAVLDAYYLTADAPGAANPENDDGTITPAQLAWLEAEVAKTGATHKFAFAHVPYYSVYKLPPSHDDDSYTRLWNILDGHRFAAYFCGHIHLFSRKTVDAAMPPNPQVVPPAQWTGNVLQMLTGTAGAGVDTAPVAVDAAAWHVANASETYYFSVVDIDGPRLTITSYRGGKGAYEVFDVYPDPAAQAAIPTLSWWALALCALLVAAVPAATRKLRTAR